MRCPDRKKELSKRAVNLKISNKQYSESLRQKGEAFSRELNLEDEIEIMTEGNLYQKDNATYITYEEPEWTGFENDRTVIKLADGVLSIKRYGGEAEGHMDLTLQEGVKYITSYIVPMARFEIEVYTHELGGELTDEGLGRIYADYNVRFADLGKMRNKLQIDITDTRG